MAMRVSTTRVNTSTKHGRTTTSFFIEDDIREEVRRIAQEREDTLGKCLREATREWVRRQKQQEPTR